MGDVLNEFLLLLRSSPWKQTDLNGGHLFLLSIDVSRVRYPCPQNTILADTRHESRCLWFKYL
jgi:hypothetical protein